MTKSLTMTLPLCLLLAGCSDKVARECARELTNLMDEYSKRVDHLIATETARYREEARALEAARDEGALDKLAEDRQTLVTKQYLDGLIEGKADARTLMNSVLPDYAERDHNTTRNIYTKLDSAYTAHLTAMQPLAANKAKVSTLRNAFADLAKEPNVFDLATQLKTFGDDLKGNLDYERCDDLNNDVNAITADVHAITTKISGLPAGTPERLSLEEILKTTNAELLAVTGQRAKTGRYVAASNQCTRPQ